MLPPRFHVLTMMEQLHEMGFLHSCIPCTSASYMRNNLLVLYTFYPIKYGIGQIYLYNFRTSALIHIFLTNNITSFILPLQCTFLWSNSFKNSIIGKKINNLNCFRDWVKYGFVVSTFTQNNNIGRQFKHNNIVLIASNLRY